MSPFGIPWYSSFNRAFRLISARVILYRLTFFVIEILTPFQKIHKVWCHSFHKILVPGGTFYVNHEKIGDFHEFSLILDWCSSRIPLRFCAGARYDLYQVVGVIPVRKLNVMVPKTQQKMSRDDQSWDSWFSLPFRHLITTWPILDSVAFLCGS